MINNFNPSVNLGCEFESVVYNDNMESLFKDKLLEARIETYHFMKNDVKNRIPRKYHNRLTFGRKTKPNSHPVIFWKYSGVTNA